MAQLGIDDDRLKVYQMDGAGCAVNQSYQMEVWMNLEMIVYRAIDDKGVFQMDGIITNWW